MSRPSQSRTSCSVLFGAATLGLALGCAPTAPIVAPLAEPPTVAAVEEPFRATTPDASFVLPSRPLPWRTATLENGMGIAVLERHAAPVVAVRLVVDHGPVDSTSSSNAFELMQGLLGASSQAHTEESLALAFARLGAPREAVGGADACGLATQGGAGVLGGLIDLLAEEATTPRMDLRDLSNVRGRWLDSASGSRRSPAFVLHNATQQLLFGRGHAYGAVPFVRADAEAVRLEELTKLYGQLYRPGHATLVVVGDTTLDEVRAHAARAFGPWATSGAPSPRVVTAPPAVTGSQVVLLQVGPQLRTHVALAARGPAAADDDIAPLAVLVRALGGLASPLRNDVREEQGASYGFGSTLVSMRNASFAYLGGSVRADAAGATVRAMVTALRSARQRAPSDDALTQAKASLIAEHRAQMASSIALANLGVKALASGLPLGSIEGYPARIAAVTSDDTVRVAKKYFGDGALRVIAQGTKELAADLEQLGLGPVERHDVAAEMRSTEPPTPATKVPGTPRR